MWVKLTSLQFLQNTLKQSDKEFTKFFFIFSGDLPKLGYSELKAILEIYNIGTKEKIRINKLALVISKLMNKKILIKRKKISEGSTKMRCPDISKIKKMGFVKKIPLRVGLKNIIQITTDR